MAVRTDLGAADLWALARRDMRLRAAARLYAIAHVLDGKSRAEAARLCGMDRQSLRDAVVRYNAWGVDGLADRSPPGREPRLTAGEQAALAALILRGPDPERSGISGWTLADLCREAQARWNKLFHPASMSRVVRRLGLSRQKACQVHPQSDSAAQAAFAERGCGPRSTPSRPCIRTNGSPSGSRMKPCRAEWTRLPSLVAEATAPARPVRPALRMDLHFRRRPATGQSTALVLPMVSTEAMSMFLDHFAAGLAPGEHAVMVLDQAGWHGARALRVLPTTYRWCRCHRMRPS